MGREGEAAAVKVGELEVAAPGEDGFGEVGLGHTDAEVVGGRAIVCPTPLTGSDPVNLDNPFRLLMGIAYLITPGGRKTKANSVIL